MKIYLRIILLSLIVLNSVHVARAVPPPDFIFNVGRQIVQAFSFLVIGLSVGLAFIRQFFETNMFYQKHKLGFAILAAVVVISVSFLGANYYGDKKQADQYSDWLKQSQNQHSQAPSSFFNQTPSQSLSSTTTTEAGTPKLSTTTESSNKSSPNISKSISNQDFVQLPASAYVLDAREDEEYENGYYPGSVHVRAADIVEGKWNDLPKDVPIYVLCWSGIRGKEVADFLVSKNIDARYLEKGADGWVSSGGKWAGAIKFRSVYTGKEFSVVYSTEEVKNDLSQGVVLVDSRPKQKYDAKHIPGSVSFPVIYTPSDKIQAAMDQVPNGSSIITICDDFVSCFDATIVGAKFEKRGDTFLGRYSKPWEF
jgi:rhodanese-related sulfurtransferase